MICEPSTRGHHSDIARHVSLAGGRLLAAGFDVAEPVDPLRVLLARRCGRHRPGLALVLLDLLQSGSIEVVRCNAPPVRYTSAAGDVRLVPDHGGIVHGLDDGDWVFALSPSFAG